MEKSLIPLMTFTQKELLLMSAAMSVASKTLRMQPPDQEIAYIIYSNQGEFVALMKKLGGLMEAAIT